MASSLYKDKAYVNGEWVAASSGATFEGTIKICFVQDYACSLIFIEKHLNQSKAKPT